MKIRNRVRDLINQWHSSRKKATYQRSPFFKRIASTKRILLYTDSRGINIPDHYYYKHYSTRLLNRYNVEAYLCPEKWTTILDFLRLWKNVKQEDFSYIILHLGVVDASPRHQKILINEIYPEKKEMFDTIFGECNISNYHHTDLGCNYEGDKTINMYSLEMAQEYIIPRLLEIPRMIWIGANKIDTSWRGNYWKDRPANIRLVEDYSKLFAQNLPYVIDLLDLWSMEDVHNNTFDNIHPNKKGSDIIYSSLKSIINSL